MTKRVRVTIETGPKGKKVAAVAPDWPGLSRGAKTEAEAVERLLAYVPRYAPVAKLAGLERAFPKKPVADVVERYTGPGSTDFWAISFGFSSIDQAAVPAKALERELTLLRAIELLTTGPAAVLGSRTRRSGGIGIVEGAPADLVVIDRGASWTVTPDTLLSRGKDTPLLGQELPGVVLLTMADGRVAYQADAG